MRRLSGSHDQDDILCVFGSVNLNDIMCVFGLVDLKMCFFFFGVFGSIGMCIYVVM